MFSFMKLNLNAGNEARHFTLKNDTLENIAAGANVTTEVFEYTNRTLKNGSIVSFVGEITFLVGSFSLHDSSYQIYT